MQSSCPTHHQILCALPYHGLLSLPRPTWMHARSLFLVRIAAEARYREPATDALAVRELAPCEARDLLNFLAVLSPLPSDTFNDGVYLFLSGPIKHTCPASSCAPLHPDPYPESVHLRSMSCQHLLLWGFYTCYLSPLLEHSVTSFLWALSLEGFLLL